MGRIIDRRRVYGSKKEDTYIQDGLIFWLDGINKGNDPTAWTDLIGGYTFPYSEGAVIESNGVANIYSKSVQQAFHAPANTHTIEGVSNYCSTPYGILLYGKQSGDVVLANGGGIITTGNSINFGEQCRMFKTNLRTPTTVSCHDDFLMLNGNIHTYTEVTNWAQGYGSGFVIGGRYSYGYKNTSKIYSIRIYNRRLTEEEMLHNQRIDNVRFNLGLNI